MTHSRHSLRRDEMVAFRVIEDKGHPWPFHLNLLVHALTLEIRRRGHKLAEVIRWDTSGGYLIMSIQRLLPAAAAVFVLSAGVSYASTVTIEISIEELSFRHIVGNPPAITNELDWKKLSYGVPTGDLDFFTVKPANECGSSCKRNDTASANVRVKVAFEEIEKINGTNTVVATGSVTESAKYKADYKTDTDSFDWKNANTSIPVDLTNGDVLDITLIDASDWDIKPQISFDLIDPPNPNPTPIPASFPLFAAGLGAMGLFAWRRKHKAAAVAS